MPDVAALYIDDRGPYPRMLGADACWGVDRDARLYEGPWPVVAHPPCGSYGNLRHLVVPNRERRQEADCGPRAVEQVRRWGGVLEQPSGSKLWDLCGLPRPGELPDAFGGFSISVCQVDWGHVARKRTWLYWVSGGRLHDRKGRGGVVPPGIKVCSAQQRRRTPVAFADWLIQLARSARVSGRAA